MGINSFETLAEADPRRIEIVTGRKYPFGNHIKDSLHSLPPKVDMKVEENEFQRQGKSKLVVTLTRLTQSVQSTKRHYADMVWYLESYTAICTNLIHKVSIVLQQKSANGEFISADCWVRRGELDYLPWENKVIFVFFTFNNGISGLYSKHSIEGFCLYRFGCFQLWCLDIMLRTVYDPQSSTYRLTPSLLLQQTGRVLQVCRHKPLVPFLVWWLGNIMRHSYTVSTMHETIEIIVHIYMDPGFEIWILRKAILNMNLDFFNNKKFKDFESSKLVNYCNVNWNDNYLKI